MADARDLKSLGAYTPCGFESHLGYQIKMKIENLGRAVTLQRELDAVQRALEQTEKAKEKAKGGAPYGALSEHDDRSGFCIDLDCTGAVGAVILAVECVLLARKSEI